MATIVRQTAEFIGWSEQQGLPEFSGVSYNDLMTYVQACQGRGVAQKTIAHYIADLRKLFDFLISEGSAVDNPAAFIKLRGIKKRVCHHILSTAELQQLYRRYPVTIEVEPGRPMPPQERNILSRRRNKVMVGLLVNQGLRVEELRALKVQDLQLREGRITVHHQRRTAERVLELEAGQVYELIDYLADTRKQLLQLQGTVTDDLFIQHHDTADFYGVTIVILKHLRQINHAVKNLDQVRASVITHWVAVYDLRKAQYLTGHRHVSSTEFYKVQVLDELQADVKKFHPF